MSNMYFAKFNLNSNIHEVYKNPNLRIEILKKMIGAVNQEHTITDVYNNEFKFCELDRNLDDMYIAGRVVKIFSGEIETYNKKEDNTYSEARPNLAHSVAFYFDLMHEEIAFCSKRGFSNKDFIQTFKLLIEKFMPDLEFEIIMEQNFKEFESIVNRMNKIVRARLILIPPNDPNYNEFKAIYGRSFEEIEETKSTKYIQEIQVSKKSEQPINTNTKFFKNSYYAISKGYGRMTVEDCDGHSISSEISAPYKESIPEKSRDIISEVVQIGKKYIHKLLTMKSELKRDEGKGKGDSNTRN